MHCQRPTFQNDLQAIFQEWVRGEAPPKSPFFEPASTFSTACYIFPLLFFKRICDVWDEEFQEIVDETGDEQLAWFPGSHRFQIPEDCHWNDVRTKASNVGTALQRAMREIEKANPDTLYGVSPAKRPQAAWTLSW